MKPNWKDLPAWANFLALDGDGYWCWFEHEPEFSFKDNAWFCGEGIPSDSRYNTSDSTDESGIDWDFAFDSLEERPTNQI